MVGVYISIPQYMGVSYVGGREYYLLLLGADGRQHS